MCIALLLSSAGADSARHFHLAESSHAMLGHDMSVCCLATGSAHCSMKFGRTIFALLKSASFFTINQSGPCLEHGLVCREVCLLFFHFNFCR